ncbi:hypothetical protein BH11PSE9_BH11PSE9_19950 [soil metagenome]
MQIAERELRLRFERARWLEQAGQVLQAELLYVAIVDDAPGHLPATHRLAQLAMNRGDFARATKLLRGAQQVHPSNSEIAIDLAVVQLEAEEPDQARNTLESTLARNPKFATGWLLLAQVRDALGDGGGALRACFEAVTCAQRAGLWLDENTTPPGLTDAVLSAIERVRAGQRELFFGAYQSIRQEFGATALGRVDRALAGYLREWDAKPANSHQRPKFFFFPGLPEDPYHDPYLQPWARELQSAFPLIRDEALKVSSEDSALPSFVNLKPGDRMNNYVDGAGVEPSWEAFFFYRHGERYDANHARCPYTSSILDSIDLCRIAEQAPEICFSVLRPGSHIKPHYGVTNTRLVMHLPLIVPGDCALNLIGEGEHHWKEAKLVMFDDTFEHEAWNRSASTRVVLLMDCWNPHLTPPERSAVKLLIETITGLQMANRARELGIAQASA